MENKYEDHIKNAIYNYVAGYTVGVNGDLRNNKEVKDITDELDKAFTKKSKIDVYRTIELEYLQDIYNIDKDDINKVINKTLVNKGYMSTTSIFKSPWGNKWCSNDIILHITSKKEYPYIDVNSIFSKDEIDCYNQHEIILPRNTKLKVLSCELLKNKNTYKEGNYLLECEIL
jgi:hypothetical protein